MRQLRLMYKLNMLKKSRGTKCWVVMQRAREWTPSNVDRSCNRARADHSVFLLEVLISSVLPHQTTGKVALKT